MAAQQVGSGYTNQQDIINANQGNQLGSTIQSGVQNDVNQAQNSANTATNQFNTDFNAANQYGATSQNQALANQDLSDPTNANAFTNFNAPTDQQAASNGSGPANQDVQSFSQLLSGNQYNGPTQLANFSNLQQQGQNVQQLGQNTNSTGGQYNLLKQFVGGANQNYNQGEQNLDAAILGQTGQGNLSAIRQATAGVPQYINQQGTNAVSQAATQKAQNQQYAQTLQNQLAGQTQGILGNVSQQVQTVQQSDTARQNAINNFIAQLNNAAATGSNQQGTTANQLIGSGVVNAQRGAAQQRIGVTGTQVNSQPENVLTSGIGNLVNQGFLDSTQASDLTPLIQQAQQAGQTPAQIDALIAQNMSYTPGNITAQGVMTSPQAAQLNALAQLSGQQPQYNVGTPATLGGLNLNLNQIQSATENALRTKQGAAYTGPATATDANIVAAQTPYSAAPASPTAPMTSQQIQNLLYPTISAPSVAPAGVAGAPPPQSVQPSPPDGWIPTYDPLTDSWSRQYDPSTNQG